MWPWRRKKNAAQTAAAAAPATTAPTVPNRGLYEIDDELLCLSLEHSVILLRAGRFRIEYVNLWKNIDDLLDERLEVMDAKDDCDTEVIG
jgi:hypothetical protein